MVILRVPDLGHCTRTRMSELWCNKWQKLATCQGDSFCVDPVTVCCLTTSGTGLVWCWPFKVTRCCVYMHQAQEDRSSWHLVNCTHSAELTQLCCLGYCDTTTVCCLDYSDATMFSWLQWHSYVALVTVTQLCCIGYSHTTVFHQWLQWYKYVALVTVTDWILVAQSHVIDGASYSWT